ncbi:MAG: amidohydrolase family protein [Spirochaetota bacterium]|nr:amidohydrolase family protein [Spirochaetota bacterium]
MIIDVHSHLGNILEFNGGELIDKTGVKKEKIIDLVSVSEAGLNRTYGLGSLPYAIFRHWVTKAERARNATATLENMRLSLDEAGVDYTVCLPIAPYVTFDNLRKACKKEKRIIPFTSADFTDPKTTASKLDTDVKNGAYGLKLHPIIQKVRCTDAQTLEVLQTFKKHKKPVLIHAGISTYYLGKEKFRNNPEYGNIKDIEKVVRTFPDINFIIGHSGLFQVNEVIKRLKGCGNVWVDTSFQSPWIIRKLINAFGAERVMYASDWPFGYRPPAIKAVKLACKGDTILEVMLFYKNAAMLLSLKMI